MERVVEIAAKVTDGMIATEVRPAEIADLVLNEKQIVLLKSVFAEDLLLEIRQGLLDWGRNVSPVTVDDFEGNYHRQRAMVSRLNTFPHVFHDYNFHDFSKLDQSLSQKLRGLFDPLRALYNDLTSYDLRFEVPLSGPYLHPQVIHYPRGGGFFGRHWHNLLPQKMGFIVALSRYGKDHTSGGTVFDIDGQVVDIEGLSDMGDICLWRYDYHHWVKQSELNDQFDWNSTDGRWVATLPYYERW